MNMDDGHYVEWYCKRASDLEKKLAERVMGFEDLFVQWEIESGRQADF